MFVESLNAVSTGITALDLADKTLPTFTRLFKRIKDGEIKIAILGASGTGKSTLGKLLSGQSSRELLKPYEESIGVEDNPLDSKNVGKVIIVPGQERLHETWDDLLREMIQGKIQLMINTVAWGYHSFGSTSYRDFLQDQPYQSRMTESEFLKVYVKQRREREQAFLEKIVNALALAEIHKQKRKKLFLITLVTKQDLWWHDRQCVKAHYQQGQYEQQIQILRNKFGTANFFHEYCSASLIIRNFMSGSREILLPNTSGYDEEHKLANLDQFFKVIESFGRVSLNKKED
ncbi:MAG: ATP-binding cassette domain-containing protein [Microcystaceae cyanobacterium]